MYREIRFWNAAGVNSSITSYETRPKTVIEPAANSQHNLDPFYLNASVTLYEHLVQTTNVFSMCLERIRYICLERIRYMSWENSVYLSGENSPAYLQK
jgi:hypothetical protein